MEAICENCRFFQAASGQLQGSGQCRRFPPVIPQSEKLTDANVAFRTGVWPHVAGGSWCGEFQPRGSTGKA